MLPTEDSPDHDSSHRRRSDTILAVIAAAGMLALAWAGFQSAQWVRERFQRSDESTALSEEAAVLSAEADRLEERDVLLYLEWRLALAGAADETAAGIYDLFRPEFRAYLEERGDDPAELLLDQPFDDPAYDVSVERVAATEVEAASDEASRLSREASRTGARYGGLGVIFAAVLAAVAIATRFHDKWIRRTLTMIAALVFLVGFVYLVGSPLSISAP